VRVTYVGSWSLGGGRLELQQTSSVIDDPPRTKPADISGPPVAEKPSLLADLDALIAEIESAPVGNAALDARIHFGFRIATRRSPDIAALLIEQGITWPTVEAVLDEQIPPFTTSLDAALESEDITFSVRSAKRQRWGAMQKARCGEEVLAWAATEPLARRLAAIRAWRLDLEKSPSAASTAPSTLPPKQGTPAETPAGEKEWEVSF